MSMHLKKTNIQLPVKHENPGPKFKHLNKVKIIFDRNLSHQEQVKPRPKTYLENAKNIIESMLIESNLL